MAKCRSFRDPGPGRRSRRAERAGAGLCRAALALACLSIVQARAASRPWPVDPASSCAAAVAAAQGRHSFPAGLLAAIAQVESGRRDRIEGRIEPWPWTVDVDGQGHFYPDALSAIQAVRAALADGHRSVDVGCMQVNLQNHPTAFPDLETAFDPGANARYAADFLARLHDQTGDWLRAAGLYHSATPALAATYQAKIMAALGGAPPVPAPPPILLAQVFRPFGAPGFARSMLRPPPPQTGMIQNGRVLGGLRMGRTLANYRTALVRRRS